MSRSINGFESRITLMQSYVEKIRLPSLGDAWRTDELYVKVKGDMKYMYALMDDDTRFWIAQQVSGTKYTADIRPLFRKAKEITGRRPNVLISDGAPNYNQAFKDEFDVTSKSDTFDISDCKAIIIITRWKDSTERFETEKKLCVD